MVRFNSNEQLVQALSADLTPVDRLAPPSLRVLLWLAMVGSLALALTMVSGIGAMIQRLVAAPDLWLAAMGSMLTAVLAAAAAFQLVYPIGRLRGRSCRCRLSWFGSGQRDGLPADLGQLLKVLRCQLLEANSV